jgi:NitT/TauT family transport system substrate-binding protein
MPETMTRLLACCVAFLAALSGLAAQAYNLVMDPWVAWAPAMVAQEKGMWRQSLLHVAVTCCAEGDAVQRFVSRKADFALMMAGTAIGLQASGEANLVVLAEVDWSHGGDKILVKKGTKLAELKGKRLGVYEDSPGVMMFLAAKLRAEGLSIADFKIVVVEDMDSLAGQFLNGRLACAISYEPFTTKAMSAGNCEVVATTADFPGVMPEVIVGHRSVVEKMSPENLTALLSGWIDSVEWCAEPKNQKEFARICKHRVFAEEKLAEADIPALQANVRMHQRATLAERNLGKDAPIRTFLRDCSMFAAGSGGRLVDVDLMLETAALQRALSGRRNVPRAVTPAPPQPAPGR